MIVKIIPHRQHAAGFARVARYVVNAQGGIDPASWTRTVDYLLDSEHAGGGEKVGAVRVSHCHSDDPAAATMEILATQAKNTRSKGDKHYHLVISFPPGERVPLDTLQQIEDEVCAAIGLADHPRISAVHLDTEHLHVHVALSKVHPRTLRNVEPYYPQHRLMDACERLEVQYGLQRTPHGRAAGHAVRGRAADMEAHGGEQSLLQWITGNAGEALKACSAQGGSWQDLHVVLARYRLEIRPRGAGLVIGVPDEKTLAVKASRVDRSLSLKSLTDRWGAYVPPAFSDTGPERVDANGPVVTPERFAPGPVSALAARDKPEDDSRAGGENTPAPAPGGRQHSSGAGASAIGDAAGYRRQPCHSTASTAGLYAAYQRQREAALQARQVARQQLRDEHEKYTRDLKAWYGQRRQAIFQQPRLSREARRTTCRALSEQRLEDLRARRQQELAQRQAITLAHPLPTWQAFLQAAAQSGDGLALAALRSRGSRQARLAADLLTARDAGQARHVVFAQLRPQIFKNGATVYRVEDGGVVADEARQIRVEQLTAGASFLALALADERFKGRALVVEGSELFREQVVLHAALLDVRFADPALERERQRLAALRSREEASPTRDEGAASPWQDDPCFRRDRRGRVAETGRKR